MNKEQANTEINEFLSKFGCRTQNKRRLLKRLIMIMGIRMINDISKATNEPIHKIMNDYVKQFEFDENIGEKAKNSELTKRRNKRRQWRARENKRRQANGQPRICEEIKMRAAQEALNAAPNPAPQQTLITTEQLKSPEYTETPKPIKVEPEIIIARRRPLQTTAAE